MRSHLNKDQNRELGEILKKSPGRVLQAKSVVERARDTKSSLHGLFEWDDSKAGEAYRLGQARGVIRLYLIVIEPTPVSREYKLKFKPSKTRGLVSLQTDREKPGGGYRAVMDVLKDPGLRQQLVKEALDELKMWQLRYKSLNELADVFDAIARMEGKYGNVKARSV